MSISKNMLFEKWDAEEAAERAEFMARLREDLGREPTLGEIEEAELRADLAEAMDSPGNC